MKVRDFSIIIIRFLPSKRCATSLPVSNEKSVIVCGKHGASKPYKHEIKSIHNNKVRFSKKKYRICYK